MGTKCAPNYANLFMAYFEEMFIYPRIKGKSLLYLRYIDDIFLIWKGSKEELEAFIAEINSGHPGLNQVLIMQSNSSIMPNTGQKTPSNFIMPGKSLIPI